MYKTIALLTDFGTKDHYVGVVKGRILQEVFNALPNPGFFIQFIDLSHEVPPQDIKRGAILLYFSYKYFPKNTIFLCIVDPGVGTERRAILIKTSDHIFVGPDNGIFSLIYLREKNFSCFEILEEKTLRPPFSSTFHGRDLFAPAVASLLCETPLEDFTRKLSKKFLKKLNFKLPEKTKEGLKLDIWYVDHFGNLITNLHKDEIKDKKGIKVLVDGKEVPLVKTYGYGKPGEIIALFGSEGLLEIAVNRGSAERLLRKPKIEVILED